MPAASRHKKNPACDALLDGDLTTSEGMVQTAARLLRAFASGELEGARFDALMRGLEFMAAVRSGAAPTLPKAQEPHAAGRRAATTPAARRRDLVLEFIQSFAAEVARRDLPARERKEVA